MNLRRYFLILFHRIKFMISCFSCSIDDIISVLLYCYPANKVSYAMNKIHAKVKIRDVHLSSSLLINQTFNILAVQYYAKVCNEFAGSISDSPRQCALGLQSSFRRNIAAVASRWLRFEPQTSLFSHIHVTARPTYGW